MRILVLMRHAHAKGHAVGGDQARELSKKGCQQAQAVGQWLAKEGVRPDAVVVSPSRRTVQTWEEISASGLHCQEVWSDSGLYDAYPGEIAESIQSVDDGVTTLFVIAHAPGIPALADNLEDHSRLSDEARERVQSWPPATCAVVSHPGSWADFPSDDSAVAALFTPEVANS